MIRPAEHGDLGKITAITNDAIAHSHVHFATEPTTPDRVEQDWRDASGMYPWGVAVADGEVLGYAKAASWKPRGAYRWTTEVGVYVDESARGRGIGKALYTWLFAQLEVAGYRTVLAGVALPNPASERLHESLGMRRVGVLPGVGYKLGAWRDVVYYALELGDKTSAPDRAPMVSGSIPPPHQ